MIKYLGVFLFFLILGCASDGQSDLVEAINIDKVTYLDNVKIIIDNNCIVCHNSGPNPIGPFPLEIYNEVKDKAQNGALLTRIQLPAGNPSVMPKTGKMPQQLIDVIVDWAEGGFLEN
ncbi:MAG: hypothetical protein QM486_03415 [Flavobacteriaceae bacterium]